MANQWQYQNSGTPPYYVLDQQGNVTFAGEVTLGKLANPTIPDPNTLTLYTLDGTTLNTIDQTGAIVPIANSGNVPKPAASGLQSWLYDPEAAVTGVILATGVVYLHRFVVTQGFLASNVVATVTTQGSTLTSGQNFVGLYNSSGTRIAVSADQTTAWGTTGAKTMAMTTPVWLAPGTYYVGFLAVGTTPPTFAAAGGFQNAYNAGLSGATLRHGSQLTGQTSLPTSVTLASSVSTAVNTWAGIS